MGVELSYFIVVSPGALLLCCVLVSEVSLSCRGKCTATPGCDLQGESHRWREGWSPLVCSFAV